MSEILPKCRGVIGILFGHRFEDRYDEKTDGESLSSGAIQAAGDAKFITEDLASVLASARGSKSESVYVQDVCTRCGLVIDRKNPASAK